MQLSCVKHDLEDMEFIMSMGDGSLTEQLLPSRNSFFVRQLRCTNHKTCLFLLFASSYSMMNPLLLHSQINSPFLFLVCRSGVRHTNILLRGPIFRIFSINWFTYGYPVRTYETSLIVLEHTCLYLKSHSTVNRTENSECWLSYVFSLLI